MKKTLLLLSVMAAGAFSASAYDTFAPGTDAENPNYYLIRTNRGNGRGSCYLSYSDDERPNVKYAQLEDADAVAAAEKTHLYRASSATEYSLWEVTPGTESGTVVVKNYKAENAYLFAFSGGLANVTSEAVNLYLVTNEDKSFSIGTGTSGSVFLDANNWNDNCGNWNPGDEGTTWFATLVDLSNSDSVEKAIQYALYSSECSAAKSSAVAQLQGYVVVDVVADIINSGIEAINAVEVSADAASQINNILSSTLGEANTLLTTGLAGKTYIFQNLRRVASNLQPYFTTDVANSNYPQSNTFNDLNAVFEFKSVGESGYILYNEATQTYISTTQTPTAVESEAQTVYPCLANGGVYYGIAFEFAAGSTADSWNMDTRASTFLTHWSVDAGSIWNVIEFDEKIVLEQVISEYVNHLTQYAANVEPCADIFNAAKPKVQALTYSSALNDEVTAIENEAIAAANEFLKAGLDNKSVQLRSLRNGYVVPGEEWYSISNEATDACNYDFMSAENGGYTLFNATKDTFIGQGVRQDNGTFNTAQAETVEEAQVIYPVAYGSGTYYGVALAFEEPATATTQGLNTNSNEIGLHQYQIADAGSIFAIKVMGSASSSISEISAGVAAEGIFDLQGRRLNAPIRGINIINGRKVLVK